MKKLNTSTLTNMQGGGWGVTYPAIPDADCAPLYFGIKNPVFGPLPAWLTSLEGMPAHCLATGGGA